MKIGTLLLALAGLVLVWTIAGGQDNPHGSFEGDCSDCHSAEAWTPIQRKPDFKHGTVGYPLSGSHRKVACRSCHTTLQFALVATACADCHRDIHRGEFGLKCEVCHVPRSWDNRRRMWDRHSATLFPLTGVHTTLDCGACHKGNAPFQYALAPVDCIGCHEADYLGTSSPDHQASGFPTDCRLCHDTSSWDARGFPQHEALFPINSGTHAGAWNSCSDCHVVPGNFQIFECTGCHEHSESEMGEEHDDVPGYVWESSACFACHPRGNA